MHSRMIQMLTLVVVGAAAPSLHAGFVTFTYTTLNPGPPTYSGSGSFAYAGSLASIGLGNLSSFTFVLDLTSPSSIPPTAIFDYSLADLLTFSASVSGGAVTSLSFTTDTQAAINTSNFDENQKSLVVTSLAVGGATILNNDQVFNRITQSDNGTITTQGPAPEPSTALLAGGAALLLGLWHRTRRASRR
jgi:hypothetical protein